METKQYPDMQCDVVIAGCGVAGLYAALNLPKSTRVIMLSKGAVDECDSMLAQGGICVLPEGSDYDAFFEDTMHAGHYENRRESVDIMIRSSRSVINDLLAMGVDFERKADGSLDFTREGAHSRPRIAFHADITGREITTKLLQAVRKLDNVQILEHVAMTDILTGERDGFATRPKAYFERFLAALGEHARLYLGFYEGRAISGAITTNFGGKACYVYGASDNECRNHMPNYLMQWEMIRWALETGCTVYDFQGVSGNLSPEGNHMYGLYRFKKGFNGQLDELAGEFDYVYRPLRAKMVDRAIILNDRLRHLRTSRRS